MHYSTSWGIFKTSFLAPHIFGTSLVSAQVPDDWKFKHPFYHLFTKLLTGCLTRTRHCARYRDSVSKTHRDHSRIEGLCSQESVASVSRPHPQPQEARPGRATGLPYMSDSESLRTCQPGVFQRLRDWAWLVQEESVPAKLAAYLSRTGLFSFSLLHVRPC